MKREKSKLHQYYRKIAESRLLGKENFNPSQFRASILAIEQKENINIVRRLALYLKSGGTCYFCVTSHKNEIWSFILYSNIIYTPEDEFIHHDLAMFSYDNYKISLVGRAYLENKTTKDILKTIREAFDIEEIFKSIKIEKE